MKNFVYFLLITLSGSLYAEDFQIVLDPFTGGSSREESQIGDDEAPYIETEATDAIEEDTTPRMKYTRECTFEEIQEGYLKKCTLKDISYMTYQCIEEEERHGRYGGMSQLTDCDYQEVTGDVMDALRSQGVVLDVFSKSSPYSHDCSSDIHENGRYSEHCHPVQEASQGTANSISSEETFANDIADTKGNVEEGEEEGENYQEEKKEIVVPELVEKAIDGVGKVVMSTKKMDSSTSENSMGSGFFIKDVNGQPIFITNYHVFGVFLTLSFSRMFQQFLVLMGIKGNSSSDQHNWFSEEESNVVLYIEQGDQRFRIKGVRDISLLMDLAVLEVEDYTGVTLNIAEDYSNEVPVYVLGYPGGRDLQKVKLTNPFTVSTLYNSFMVSHSMDHCLSGLHGISGSPVVNISGEVVGVAFSHSQGAVNCSNMNIIPLDGFDSVDFMSSVKANKEDMISLVIEEESSFYNQLIFSDERRDVMAKAVFYARNGMLLSKRLDTVSEDMLLNLYQKLDSGTELNEEDVGFFKFLVQRKIADVRGMDLNGAAELGSLEARFLLAKNLYNMENFEESQQLFQELVQLRIPLYLYTLSKIYYEEEENSSQACRLLTYAEEPVEVLDDLYQEYECDDVLGGAS